MGEHGKQQQASRMHRVPATNWAGSFHYGFRDGLFPASLEQVSEAVSGALSVKVLGSRHSFNGIVDGTLDSGT